ncbi:MAG: DUF1311 domain-containing protein [Thermoanaerobaculia bacterium]|nr:DUF1311 domain-containing protein [Thermoanaerobaculia bacterium]
MNTPVSVVLLLLLHVPSDGPAAVPDPCNSPMKAELIRCETEARERARERLDLYLGEIRGRWSDSPAGSGDDEVIRLLDAAQRAWEELVAADCQAVYRSWGPGEREIQFLACQADHAESRARSLWWAFLSTSTTELTPPPDPCEPRGASHNGERSPVRSGGVN